MNHSRPVEAPRTTNKEIFYNSFTHIRWHGKYKETAMTLQIWSEENMQWVDVPLVLDDLDS